jgi:predicted dehydrogenase
MSLFSSNDIANLNSTIPLPSEPKKIVIIGAGGIVSDAHLPAYKKAGFEVLGIFDPQRDKADKCAKDFNIQNVYSSEEEAFLEKNVVFDIAVPPQILAEVVKKIPQGSICQLQKPMGNSMKDAKLIKETIKENKIIACVNLQLKFSPMMIALREAINKNMIGDISELEVSLSVKTPWHLWPFLETLDNVEVPLHSIHYLDWIRSVLGNPISVHCKSVKHPNVPKLSDARSSIILEYEKDIRCCLSINHTHDTDMHGMKHSHAYARVEGNKGAAYIKFGLLLNYPKGEPEEIEISTDGVEWTKVNDVGTWFPDAFIGTMSSLQRYAAGEDEDLLHSIDNAYETMALVYACLKSNETPGTTVEYK